MASNSGTKVKAYPISVHRTDGESEVVNRFGISEPNRPTDEQLDATPDANGKVDCYIEVPLDHEKSMEWRRKLGGMHIQLFGREEHRSGSKQYFFEDFPTEYTLWMHVKYTKDPKTGEHRDEERLDTYLYGYPEGRKKRFRSPAEFFCHLAWLMTTSKDPDDCPCKFCSPTRSEKSADEASEPDASATPAIETEDTEMTADMGKLAMQPSPAPSVAPVEQSYSKPSIARLPLASHHEQQVDQDRVCPYVYRGGEMVWFSRGSAWGLAIVSSRSMNGNEPYYVLQALSHPFENHPEETRSASDIRPWLSWSAPETTHEALRDMAYDSVHWKDVIAGRYGGGEVDVDGSILAAKKVDTSYTLFAAIHTVNAPPGERSYNGIYFGAERIWVGEPVRLRMDRPDEVLMMVIHRIIEKQSADPKANSCVTFIGDVFKFKAQPSPYADYRDLRVHANLPPRVAADLEFRNEVAAKAGKRLHHNWLLEESMGSRPLEKVSGRWYKAEELLPILLGKQGYEQEMQGGELTHPGILLNGRMEKDGGGPGEKAVNRRALLGAAVPPTFRMDLDGPQQPVQPAAAQPPAQSAYQDQSGGGSGWDGKGSMEQFIDLDGALG